METVQAIRDSVASIPSNISSLIHESSSLASSYLSRGLSGSLQSISSSPSSFSSNVVSSTDENMAHIGGNKSLPIPASLIKEQWRLIFTSDANEQDLKEAIAHAKDLVLLSDECSEERRWLVRHLVDLRYSLKELEEAKADPYEKGPSIKTVVGHHFVQHNFGGRFQAATKRFYCDYCSGIIWSVVQKCYICKDCEYLAHQKCVDHVIRVCAHFTVTERQYPISEICPEIGLAAQKFQCAECGTLLNCKSTWIEPRLCDYNGLYYCPSCHWNDRSPIPARIVHNWDFSPRKVSRVSLQELKIFYDKPLIKLEECNSKLFGFLGTLAAIKTIRQKLVYMRKYLIECRNAIEEKLLETQMGTRRYLVQTPELYSISDLEQAESGALSTFLNKVYTVFDNHIRNCEICKAKAYICEICQYIEVLYPFDDGCILCEKCNSIYHRVCKTRKNLTCPKCIRIKQRQENIEKSHDNDDDDD